MAGIIFCKLGLTIIPWKNHPYPLSWSPTGKPLVFCEGG